MGAPVEFSKQQNDKERAIHFDRPPSTAFPIPATLLNPIFGKFIDDCQTHEPTAEDNKLILKLSTAMSSFFGDELTRASKFREILGASKMDFTSTVLEGTRYTTDGDIQSNKCRYAILEVKNEIGSSSAEPHFQAMSYYVCSTKPKVSERAHFRFPCILITLFGELSILQR